MALKYVYVVDLFARLETLETSWVPLSKEQKQQRYPEEIRAWFRSTPSLIR